MIILLTQALKQKEVSQVARKKTSRFAKTCQHFWKNFTHHLWLFVNYHCGKIIWGVVSLVMISLIYTVFKHTNSGWVLWALIFLPSSKTDNANCNEVIKEKIDS